MDERAQYLDRVATGLPFEEAEQQEILHELTAHLDDSVAILRLEGLDRDSADRAALDRLGPPDSLAVALTKARRSPGRLWAAVGTGAWATVTAVVSGYLFGLLLVVISAAVFLIASPALRALTGWSSGWDSAANTALTLLTLTVAAVATGVRVPAAVAARAGYRQNIVRRLSIPLGGAAWLAFSLFVWRGPLSWAGVVVLLSLPVCFAVGALRGTGTRFPPRGWWRPMTALVLSAAAFIAATGMQAGANATSAPLDLGPVAAATPEAITQAQLGGSTLYAGGSEVMTTVVDDRSLLAGWHDLRVEAWQAVGPDGMTLVPGGPFAVSAATFGPPGVDGVGTWSGSTPWPAAAVELSGTLRIDHTPGVSWAWLALTGVAPDGVRYLLADPQSQQTAFDGTVWDWFTVIAGDHW